MYDIINMSFEDILKAKSTAYKNWVNAYFIAQRWSIGEKAVKSRIMARIAKEQPDLNRNERLDAVEATEEWDAYLTNKLEAEKVAKELEDIKDNWISCVMMKIKTGVDN